MADYLGSYRARKRACARVCFFNILRLKVGSKVLPLAGSTLQSTLVLREGGRVTLPLLRHCLLSCSMLRELPESD